MFKAGDRVRVKSSGAAGIVQENLTAATVCVEFDHQEVTRQTYSNDDLELIPPGAEITTSQLMHADL